MDIGVHLTFNGNCREAFEFYQGVFGGSLRLFTYAESPSTEDIRESWKDKIVHANLKIDDKEIAGCDLDSEHYVKPQGISMLVEVGNAEQVNKIFTTLREGGYVIMKPQKTFWSQHFCAVTDRFGITWEIY